MANKNQKPVTPVVKPFLKGNPTDERTGKGAMAFFGILLIIVLMTFIVCSMITMNSGVLRILLNAAVEVLVLVILYNSAAGRGAEAVARGEILYQKQERGQPYTEGEKAVCYHPLKGYLIGLLGTLPLLVCALVLAVTAQRQTTGPGVLPGWLSSYQQRSDVGNALAAYQVQGGLGLEDALRLIVRIAVMPFVSMIGAENRDGMLLLERLSPLAVLLPACAYGTGYLQGRRERTRIHTGIAESDRRRVRRERKARKARLAPKPKTPQQLN